MVMEQRLTRTVGPTEEPVTLAEVKDHLELLESDSHHDAKLTRFLQAAREKVERDTGQIMITQTWVARRHEFPDYGEAIELPEYRPLVSVTGITYYDEANAQQTLATTVYGVDTTQRLIHLKYDQEWPSITQQHNGIEITMQLGYGGSENVPALLKELVLLLTGAMWCERGDGDEKAAKSWMHAYNCMISTVERASYP